MFFGLDQHSRSHVAPNCVQGLPCEPSRPPELSRCRREVRSICGRNLETLSSRPLLAAVNVAVKSRKVRVKGPRGILTKDFKHIRLSLTMQNVSSGALVGR